MDSVVHRLHRALAEALARRRPDFEAAPVTVAEIYQELVPYSIARSSIGFEMNADYEHALMRLLAGEHSLLRLEPEEVRASLEHELESSNPDVTLFRHYAACDVWVSRPPAGGAAAPVGSRAGRENVSAGRQGGASRDPEPTARGPRSMPAKETGPSADAGEEPPAEPLKRERSSSRVEGAERELEREMPPGEPGRPAAARCSFCLAALPADRPVRYCPYCGADQQLQPCARCGEVLEPGWRYCVSCGAPASPAGG